MNKINAGNNIPRTKNVSIKIPIATIKLKTNRSANVAAKINPAEEITPQVLRIAIFNI